MLNVSIIKRANPKAVFLTSLASFFLLFTILFSTAENMTIIKLNQLNKVIGEEVLKQKIPDIPEAFAGLVSSPIRYYVDGAVAASGDGASWATAFKTIQKAVAAAVQPSEIWVKAGTYLVHAAPDNNPDGIVVDKVVYLFGGFTGQEKSLGERNWEKNRTILDAEKKGRCLLITRDAYLDGFTMTNGLAGDSYDSGGGAVRITESSPGVRHCIFKANKASLGGGGAISLVNGRPFFLDCSFEENVSMFCGGAIDVKSGYPVLLDCLFKGNRAQDSWGGAFNGLAIIARCCFDSNESTGDGGAISFGSSIGAGSAQPEPTLCIQQSTFIGNSAGYSGGAIFGRGSIIGCRFDKNIASDGGGAIYVCRSTIDTNNKTIIANSVFTNNVYTNYYGYNLGGGAIGTGENTDTYVFNSSFIKNRAGVEFPTYGGAYANNGNSWILNCTFWGNTVMIDSIIPVIHETGEGGTLFNGTGHTLTLVKCILWNNYGNSLEISGDPAELFYCDVDQADLAGANHNIRSDPLFVAPLTGNFHLQPDSPCGEAGSHLDAGGMPYNSKCLPGPHLY